MTDNPSCIEPLHRVTAAEPASPGSGQRSPSDEQVSLEQDLAWLAWLQSSPILSSQSTGYICDALLQWAMLGEPWPDPAEPAAGTECDHLELLVQVTERHPFRT